MENNLKSASEDVKEGRLTLIQALSKWDVHADELLKFIIKIDNLWNYHGLVALQCRCIYNFNLFYIITCCRAIKRLLKKTVQMYQLVV